MHPSDCTVQLKQLEHIEDSHYSLVLQMKSQVVVTRD